MAQIPRVKTLGDSATELYNYWNELIQIRERSSEETLDIIIAKANFAMQAKIAVELENLNVHLRAKMT